MEAPDYRPLMVFAIIGMIVTAPLWLPFYALARIQDWWEVRRERKEDRASGKSVD